MSEITRRRFVQACAASAAAMLMPSGIRGDAAPRCVPLTPRPAAIPLLGPDAPLTRVWGYNGQVPGPEIRLRHGQRLRVEVENRLDQDTTVHWHGLRIANAMDGVPYLTQAPIQPGGRFVYDFEPPDAGTYWYHPHVRGTEQQGRGLYGALIVEEYEPPRVDREVTWVIDDWRLTDEGAIHERFDDPMDLSHAGRLGNVATLDGQAVTPYEAEDGRIVLPPATRADLILDMAGRSGEVSPGAPMRANHLGKRTT